MGRACDCCGDDVFCGRGEFCLSCYGEGCSDISEIDIDDAISIIVLNHNIDDKTKNNCDSDDCDFVDARYDIYIGPEFYGTINDNSELIRDKKDELKYSTKIGTTAPFRDSNSCSFFDPVCKCVSRRDPYVVNVEYSQYTYVHTPYISDEYCGNEGYLVHGGVKMSDCLATDGALVYQGQSIEGQGEFIYDDDCHIEDISICCNDDKDIVISLGGHKDENKTECFVYSPTVRDDPRWHPAVTEFMREFGNLFVPENATLQAYGVHSRSERFGVYMGNKFTCSKCDIASWAEGPKTAKISISITEQPPVPFPGTDEEIFSSSLEKAKEAAASLGEITLFSKEYDDNSLNGERVMALSTSKNVDDEYPWVVSDGGKYLFMLNRQCYTVGLKDPTAINGDFNFRLTDGDAFEFKVPYSFLAYPGKFVSLLPVYPWQEKLQNVTTASGPVGENKFGDQNLSFSKRGTLLLKDRPTASGNFNQSLEFIVNVELTGVEIEHEKQKVICEDISKKFVPTFTPGKYSNEIPSQSRTKVSVTIAATSEKAVEYLRKVINDPENTQDCSPLICGVSSNIDFDLKEEIKYALNNEDEDGNNPNIIIYDKQIIQDINEQNCTTLPEIIYIDSGVQSIMYRRGAALYLSSDSIFNGRVSVYNGIWEKYFKEFFGVRFRSDKASISAPSVFSFIRNPNEYYGCESCSREELEDLRQDYLKQFKAFSILDQCDIPCCCALLDNLEYGEFNIEIDLGYENSIEYSDAIICPIELSPEEITIARNDLSESERFLYGLTDDRLLLQFGTIQLPNTDAISSNTVDVITDCDKDYSVAWAGQNAPELPILGTCPTFVIQSIKIAEMDQLGQLDGEPLPDYLRVFNISNSNTSKSLYFDPSSINNIAGSEGCIYDAYHQKEYPAYYVSGFACPRWDQRGYLYSNKFGNIGEVRIAIELEDVVPDNGCPAYQFPRSTYNDAPITANCGEQFPPLGYGNCELGLLANRGQYACDTQLMSSRERGEYIYGTACGRYTFLTSVRIGGVDKFFGGKVDWYDQYGNKDETGIAAGYWFPRVYYDKTESTFFSEVKISSSSGSKTKTSNGVIIFDNENSIDEIDDMGIDIASEILSNKEIELFDYDEIPFRASTHLRLAVNIEDCSISFIMIHPEGIRKDGFYDSGLDTHEAYGTVSCVGKCQQKEYWVDHYACLGIEEPAYYYVDGEGVPFDEEYTEADYRDKVFKQNIEAAGGDPLFEHVNIYFRVISGTVPCNQFSFAAIERLEGETRTVTILGDESTNHPCFNEDAG